METDKIHVPLSQEFLILGGCPMCKSGSLLVQFEGWEEDQENLNKGLFVGINLTRVECSNEPDIESKEYNDFSAWHDDMPYVNWLPRISKIEKLLNEKYTFDENLKDESEPIILTLCEPKEAVL